MAAQGESETGGALLERILFGTVFVAVAAVEASRGLEHVLFAGFFAGAGAVGWGGQGLFHVANSLRPRTGARDSDHYSGRGPGRKRRNRPQPAAIDFSPALRLGNRLGCR